MKTLTINSATKKLEKLNANKTTIAYKNVLSVIYGAKQIRPVYTQGSGRHISIQNHTANTCNLLSSVGIEFTLTNDSPRGGACGALITITTKIK